MLAIPLHGVLKMLTTAVHLVFLLLPVLMAPAALVEQEELALGERVVAVTSSVPEDSLVREAARAEPVALAVQEVQAAVGLNAPTALITIMTVKPTEPTRDA